MKLDASRNHDSLPNFGLLRPYSRLSLEPYQDPQRPTHPAKGTKTYDSLDSLLVTHATTNRPLSSLSMAERTGSPVILKQWSYVTVKIEVLVYESRENME